MCKSAVLGFPRIGSCSSLTHEKSRPILIVVLFVAGKNREIKKAVEAYWACKITAEELQKVAADTRKLNWTALKEKGVDYIPR